MKRPWYDTLLLVLGVILTWTLLVLIPVTGVTTLVTFLSIMFIGVGGLYTGMSIGRRYCHVEVVRLRGKKE